MPSQKAHIVAKLDFEVRFWVIDMKPRRDANQSVTYEIPDHESFLQHLDQAIAKVCPKCTGLIRLFDRKRPHIDRPRYAMNRSGNILSVQVFNCYVQ